MHTVIKDLLTLLETSTPDVKQSCLLDICDYMEHPYPNEEGYADVVQQLIILLSRETDLDLRKLFVRSIERGYMYQVDLSGISFESLIRNLDSSDTYLIKAVLYLLSLTYKREYIPLIETYLTHTDEEVRTEAEYILKTW